MLDAKLLRSDPDAVAANLARRGFKLDVARFRVGRKASDPQAAAYKAAGGRELGPGNYVLYWLWSGFTDGVDITVPAGAWLQKTLRPDTR